MLSVVIPTLNAEAGLPATLGALVPAAIDGLVREVIVVDGGSIDTTLKIAEEAGVHLLHASPGRGGQIATGIAAAREAFVLVLHADARLEPGFEAVVTRFLTSRAAQVQAGYFQLTLDDPSPAARRLEGWVAWRARVFGLPYGDQGLLIAKALLENVGGYPDLVLMEDVALARKLGRRGFAALQARIVTRALKHERNGYLRQSLANLVLLARFLLGADPETLAQAYR